MKEQMLAFFGFPTDRKTVRDLVGDIRNHWPDSPLNTEDGNVVCPSVPRIEFYDSWDHLLVNGTPDSPENNDKPKHAEPSACVVAITNQDAPHLLFPLLDALAARSIPMLILADDEAAVRERFYEDEIIVCPADEPLDRITLRLHALVSRQETVRQLKRDLQTARRCQGGLHGEINRIEEELQLAAMIQREFLPKTMPEVADARFGVLFKPAGYVSGDIYHIARLDENHLGFFLADAVGHGVPAALMTMVIAHGLTMKEILADSYRIIPPGEVLAKLNAAIISEHAENGRFATGVYGIIDIRSYQVTLASAGHPPPLKIDHNGQSEFIEGTGGLLGVFPDEQYGETSFTLQPGEKLFMYSDGFETAFPEEADSNALPALQNHQRRLPTLRYLDEISNACRTTDDANEIINTLQEAVDAQAGSLHQIDDLTGICLARLPLADSIANQAPQDLDSARPPLAA